MAIVLALGAAFAYGSADFVGGLAARRTSPLVSAFGAQVSGLLVLLTAMPFLGHASFTPRDLAFGAVAGLFGGGGLVLLYRALAEGPMSVVAPVTALSASLVPILAGLLLGDRPGLMVIAGIAVSLVAVLLITRERPASEHHVPASRQVLLLALGGGAIFGLFFVCLHQTSSSAGLWPLLAARFVSVPMLALLVRRSHGGAFEVPRLTKHVMVSGSLDMGANICYLIALRHGMLAVVAALTGLYPASTIILAQSHLRERLHLPQVVGLGVAACAAVLIAL
ncbi:EamA family transporter [Aquihabitans sp. McL0605]|uniref:EamA family transporter n=1 Tax=Aquihabitans sp. McL0605 TaxID=3415671 RepID=UPI003CF747A4